MAHLFQNGEGRTQNVNCKFPGASFSPCICVSVVVVCACLFLCLFSPALHSPLLLPVLPSSFPIFHDQESRDDPRRRDGGALCVCVLCVCCKGGRALLYFDAGLFGGLVEGVTGSRYALPLSLPFYCFIFVRRGHNGEGCFTRPFSQSRVCRCRRWWFVLWW